MLQRNNGKGASLSLHHEGVFTYFPILSFQTSTLIKCRLSATHQLCVQQSSETTYKAPVVWNSCWRKVKADIANTEPVKICSEMWNRV